MMETMLISSSGMITKLTSTTCLTFGSMREI
jgi:hypothetical protein